jgi:hypothetical protein
MNWENDLEVHSLSTDEVVEVAETQRQYIDIDATTSGNFSNQNCE